MWCDALTVYMYKIACVLAICSYIFCSLFLEVPLWLWHLSGGTDAVFTWFSSLYGKMFPHLNVSYKTTLCNLLLFNLLYFNC